MNNRLEMLENICRDPDRYDMIYDKFEDLCRGAREDEEFIDIHFDSTEKKSQAELGYWNESRSEL